MIDEVRECRELFDKIENALEASWDLMYYEAKCYHEIHGNLNMPTKYRTEINLPLGMRLLIQREVREGLRTGRLEPEQIAKLDQIGMQRKCVSDRNWEIGYEQAKRYRTEHGDLDVPRDCATDGGYPLGNWIASMRLRYKGKGGASPLNSEQTEWLNQLGMIWSSFEDSWERGYAETQYYFQQHESLEAPLNYERNGICLRRWLRTQRRRMKLGKLSASRRGRLEQLGMVWELPDDWDEKYSKARAYFTEQGNLEASGTWLGKWIAVQQKAWQREARTEEKINRLNDLGMRWETKKVQFSEDLAEAKYYLKNYGDLNPPSSYERNGVHLRTRLNPPEAQQQAREAILHMRERDGSAWRGLEVAFGLCDACWHMSYSRSDQ